MVLTWLKDGIDQEIPELFKFNTAVFERQDFRYQNELPFFWQVGEEGSKHLDRIIPRASGDIVLLEFREGIAFALIPLLRVQNGRRQ